MTDEEIKALAGRLQGWNIGPLSAAIESIVHNQAIIGELLVELLLEARSIREAL